MGGKRRLLLLLTWLVAPLIWIVFAFLHAIAPQFDEIAWTFVDLVEAAGILLGLPVAALGAGIAVLWIVRGSAPRSP
jgi:hypothetical protein